MAIITRGCGLRGQESAPEELRAIRKRLLELGGYRSDLAMADRDVLRTAAELIECVVEGMEGREWIW